MPRNLTCLYQLVNSTHLAGLTFLAAVPLPPFSWASLISLIDSCKVRMEEWSWVSSFDMDRDGASSSRRLDRRCEKGPLLLHVELWIIQVVIDNKPAQGIGLMRRRDIPLLMQPPKATWNGLVASNLYCLLRLNLQNGRGRCVISYHVIWANICMELQLTGWKQDGYLRYLTHLSVR